MKPETKTATTERRTLQRRRVQQERAEAIADRDRLADYIDKMCRSQGVCVDRRKSGHWKLMRIEL